MATRGQLILFITFVAAVAYASADEPFKPIPNLDAPYIQGYGRWAVQEHVNQAGDGLTFNKVVGGQFQLVPPALLYLLVIDTTNADGTDSTHTAQVFVQFWTNTRRLDYFN